MASDVLVVASKVKEYIKSKGAKTSGETIPALSDMVCKVLDDAIKRAQANKRSTVKPSDL
jgi:hypothetical protein